MDHADLKKLRTLLAIMRSANKKDVKLCVWDTDVEILAKAVTHLEESIPTGWDE